MKRINKILLVTWLMISTNAWASPMDEVCMVVLDVEDTYTKVAAKISECERNNILLISSSKRDRFNLVINGDGEILVDAPFSNLISLYCRYDRNVDKSLDKNWREVSCVLYSPVPRTPTWAK